MNLASWLVHLRERAFYGSHLPWAFDRRQDDDLFIGGNVLVETWRRLPSGIVVPDGRQTFHNRVTNVGLTQIRDSINGDAITYPTHLAVGTGTTAAAAGDTALETEVFRDTLTTSSVSGLVVKHTYYLGTSDANGNTLTEAGLLNAAAAGDLFARALLATPVPKTASITVTFTWSFALGVATALTITKETGFVIYLDGRDTALSFDTAYPSGGGVDKLASGSGIWYLDPADLPAGTYALEAMMKSNHASGTVTMALFNLDDAPDSALVGSEVTGSVGELNGERIRSGSITFDAPGADKRYGVKVHSNNASYGASVWAIRIIQTS